jgi:hypothetical protein
VEDLGCIAVEIYFRKIIKSKIKQRRFNLLFNLIPCYMKYEILVLKLN